MTRKIGILTFVSAVVMTSAFFLALAYLGLALGGSQLKNVTAAAFVIALIASLLVSTIAKLSHRRSRGIS